MDRNEAIKAANRGAITAIIAAGLILIKNLYAMSTNGTGDLAYWNDPLLLFDVALYLLLAYGMYRKSRAAATIALIVYLYSIAFHFFYIGKANGFLLYPIFLYLYVKAIQGTFVYHRIEREENPNYRAPSRWWVFAGVPVSIVAIILYGFAFLSVSGLLPSTEVLAGNKIPKNQMETLLSEGIIEQDETIEYFFSAGFTSILEDGNILTDQRVISYFSDEESVLQVDEVLLSNITRIELIQPGSFTEYSVYQITTDVDDYWFTIYLSTENEGDIRFIEELEEKTGKKVQLPPDYSNKLI